MPEMDDLLGNLDDAFQNAKGFEPADGTYVMWLKACEICKAKNSERIHIKMPMQIMEGDYKNLLIYSYELHFTDREGAPDPRGMSFFKLACEKMGLGSPQTMQEAQEAVIKFENRVIEVERKTNGDFKNHRILRLVHPDAFEWMEKGGSSADSSKSEW